jgi:hypothetical protein
MADKDPSEFKFDARKENYNIVTVTLEDILSNTLDKVHLDIFETTGETVYLGPPPTVEGLPRFVLLFSQWSTTPNDNLQEKLQRYVQENIYFYKPKQDDD